MLATNASKFTSLGPAIRLRTKPSPHASKGSTVVTGNSTGENEPAAVHTTSSPFEADPPSPSIRDSGGIQHQTKRTVSGRRNSPVTSTGEHSSGQLVQADDSDEDESTENLQRLTERLEFLRIEVQRTKRETYEEEHEFKRQHAELARERDGLKQTLKEKELTSSELRRHGNHLDKINRSAQSKKAAKEKQLHQKKADRQKLRDDTAKWEKETIEMKQDTEEMIKEMANVLAAKDKEVADTRRRIDGDLVIIKSLEEENRIKGIQIKKLEKEKEKTNNEDSEEHDRSKIEKESDQEWETKVQAIQTQIGSLWQAAQQAESEKQQADDHLAWWMSKRARNPEQFAPISSLDFGSIVQRNKSRRSRLANPRTGAMSSPSAGYPSGATAYNSASLVSPPFSAASPFFNISSGTTVPSVLERKGMSQTESEIFTSGGPMSPAANSLLPSNLFRDDDVTAPGYSDAVRPEPPAYAFSDPFLGHVVSKSEPLAHGPHPPVSASSRPEGFFPSPHDSLHNLHGYQPRPDPFAESDQYAIDPTGASFHPSLSTDSNTLATSRLANLFSSTFNRQRGKSRVQEPPLLGTLKQGQSQSFPRNLEQDSLDTNGSGRRRGSHGNWANPMAGLLNRNTANAEDSGLITARTGSGRRSRLNMFGSRFAGLEPATFADQPPLSRPSSTYSHDQALTRPSSDSQRLGWSIPDSIPTRSSPLGANWSANAGPWSRAPSRRPSVQHGSTSNLSIGSTPLEPEGFPGPFPKLCTEQAPIGTRPQSSRRPVTPKLNPAAPTFKTLFSRSDAKKSGRGEKLASILTDKLKAKDSEKGDTDEIESVQESSPHYPRLSRDAQSINTAASNADSHDSVDRSTSSTPSEALTPSAPKETLMQKITRKSSSSKFNVPWAKERGLFSKRAGEPSTPGDMDEDGSSEGQLGKSYDSAGSTPLQEKSSRASISWPNIRRKPRKGENCRNRTSERGSELGDDDEA